MAEQLQTLTGNKWFNLNGTPVFYVYSSCQIQLSILTSFDWYFDKLSYSGGL